MPTTPRLAKPLTLVTTDAALGSGGLPDQGDAQIAALLAPGGYVVVWTDASRVHNPENATIVGQRYNAIGEKVGGEVKISPFNTSAQITAAVTILTNGNIAIAYTDVFFGDNDIRVDIFSPTLDFLRHDPIDTGDLQTDFPSITALAGGAYAITYSQGTGTDTDIVGRIVSNTGAIGGAFDIRNENDNLEFPEVATLSDGNWVAVWLDEFNGDFGNHDVNYRIYTPAGGTVVGASFVPGANGTADEFEHDVAALPGGGFVVVWTEGDIGFTDIRASISTNTGSFFAINIPVNTTTTGAQGQASVFALPDGGFVVLWDDATAHDAVRGQRFNQGGFKIGSEFLLASGSEQLGRPEGVALHNGLFASAFNILNSDVDVFTGLWDPYARRYDFNGDFRSDLLLQNIENGAVRFLLRDSTGISFTDVNVGGGGDPKWRIVSGGGDFNGDGINDILWHHDNGAITQWIVHGTTFTQGKLIGGGDPNWRVIATGDFNGDSLSDIVWQHTNGGITLWLRSGSADPTDFIQFSNVGGGGISAWKVITTGDFNQDGKSDILWQQDSGAVTIWLMDGANFTQTGLIGGGDPNWRIVATGEFNGDGAKNDIIWQHTNGAITIWERDTTSTNPVAFNQFSLVGGNGDLNWRVKGTADVNQDGRTDVLFQNINNGNVVEWIMNAGANFTQIGVVPANDGAWQLIGVA